MPLFLFYACYDLLIADTADFLRRYIKTAELLSTYFNKKKVLKVLRINDLEQTSKIKRVDSKS